MKPADQAIKELYLQVEPEILQEFLQETFIETLVEDYSLTVEAKRHRHGCYMALQELIKNTRHLA